MGSKTYSGQCQHGIARAYKCDICDKVDVHKPIAQDYDTMMKLLHPEQQLVMGSKTYSGQCRHGIARAYKCDICDKVDVHKPIAQDYDTMMKLLHPEQQLATGSVKRKVRARLDLEKAKKLALFHYLLKKYKDEELNSYNAIECIAKALQEADCIILEDEK